MALPPHQEDNSSKYDKTLASAIREAEEWGERLSRRRLMRLLSATYGCGLPEARAAVEAYCVRYGIALTEPPAKPPQVFAGCLLVLLIPVLLVGAIFGIFVGTPHRLMTPVPEPVWVTLMKYSWAVLLTALLVNDLRGRKLRQSLLVLRQIGPGLVAQNFCVLLVTIGFALLIVDLFPFLDRSWLYLLPGNNDHAANLNLFPATIKYFGPFFLLLLALNLPALAHSEEVKYRQGTRNWRDAAGRSVRFGLVHCFVGIPLYAGLALTVAGLWFTFQYFQGGVERSTLHHVTYNVSVVVVLFIVLLLRY